MSSLILVSASDDRDTIDKQIESINDSISPDDFGIIIENSKMPKIFNYIKQKIFKDNIQLIKIDNKSFGEQMLMLLPNIPQDKEYIMFMDAHSFFDINKINLVKKIFKKNNHISSVSGYYSTIEGYNYYRPEFKQEHMMNHNAILHNLSFRMDTIRSYNIKFKERDLFMYDLFIHSLSRGIPYRIPLLTDYNIIETNIDEAQKRQIIESIKQ